MIFGRLVTYINLVALNFTVDECEAEPPARIPSDDILSKENHPTVLKLDNPLHQRRNNPFKPARS
jgi:hypothetical protein